MVSLRDIAHDVGVSVSLVSKVLNDRFGTTVASERTVVAVRRAAQRLGYRKNASAIALLEGRHNIIGVFIHCTGMAGSGILEELLGGISEVAHAHRQRLQLNFFSTMEEFKLLRDGAHRGQMDGLVVGGVNTAGVVDGVRAIHAAGLPVVTLYERPVHPELPNVGISDVRVAQMATAHLIARGARQIAHIRNMDTRHEGYRLALAAAGLPYAAARVFDAGGLGFDHGVGERAIETFLDAGVPMDGIVAQSDQEAMGCLNVLFRRGLRVPQDVRVIGIDNAPYCDFARVPLSSVSTQFRQRGHAAMSKVLSLIEGLPARSTTVRPVLVVRDST